MAEQLKICSFNVHGVKNCNWQYLRKVVSEHHFALIQEHWLIPSEFHLFEDHLPNVNVICSSGIDETKLLRGRPHGGCAIIWHSDLNCSVVPVEIENERICAVRANIDGLDIFLASIYMPCDTLSDVHSNVVFVDTLNDISSLVESLGINAVICGGDFNTDLRRSRSLHTKSLRSFVESENFMLLADVPSRYDVEYTYESKSNGARSIIDHFLVTLNLVEMIDNVTCKLDVDNASDHNVLSLGVNIAADTVHHNARTEERLRWSSASDADIGLYKRRLDEALDRVAPPLRALRCTDALCRNEEHSRAICDFHDDIINACLAASSCIPKTRRMSHIPGWNEFVEPVREQAMHWHSLWIEQGRPADGHVAEMRRSTRKTYHSTLKSVKREEEHIRKCCMASKFLGPSKRDFWTEVQRAKGGWNKKMAASVDGIASGEGIAALFSNKYQRLYTTACHMTLKLYRRFKTSSSPRRQNALVCAVQAPLATE